MLMIDGDTVHRLLDYAELVDALAMAHRETPPAIGRALLENPAARRAGEAFLVLPAWAFGRAFGVKMVTILPENALRGDGLPTVQAVYQLFDGRDGRPVAAIDGTALTLRKTAADSALGARLLARSDARTLVMIGAGALAPHVIRAHLAVRPAIDRVLIWNRTPDRRNTLIAALADEGIPVEAAYALEPAVRQADIVAAATMADRPLIEGAWLRDGCHVDLIGGFTPAMREADDEAVRRAAIFVDYRGSTVGEVGDLTQPMAAGVIGESDIRGDLFDLCQGRVTGREDDRAITLYKNGGGAHLDLFTAEALAARLGLMAR